MKKSKLLNLMFVVWLFGVLLSMFLIADDQGSILWAIVVCATAVVLLFELVRIKGES